MSVEDLRWQKSSRSAPDNNCVEVAFTGTNILTRDSKNPGGEPLQFTEPAWRRFLDALRAGKLDDALLT